LKRAIWQIAPPKTKCLNKQNLAQEIETLSVLVVLAGASMA